MGFGYKTHFTVLHLFVLVLTYSSHGKPLEYVLRSEALMSVTAMVIIGNCPKIWRIDQTLPGLLQTNMSGSLMISPQFISTKPDRDQLARKEYFPYVNKTS